MPPKKSLLASRLAAREKKKSRFDSFGDEDDLQEATMNQLVSAKDIHHHDNDNDDEDDVDFSNDGGRGSKKKKPSASATTTSRMMMTGTGLRKQQRLQKRGPLSEAFSTGKYAAKPRHLDEDELDDDEDFDFDEEDFDEEDFDEEEDEDDFPKPAKRGKAAAATSSQKKSKRSVGFAAVDEDEIEGKLEDVDDIFGILDAPSDDDDFIAGAADEDEIAERIELKKRDPDAHRRMQKRKTEMMENIDGTADMYEDDEDEARQIERAKDEDRDLLQQIADLRRRQTEEKTGVAVEENVSVAEQLRQAASFLGSTFTALLRFRLKLQPALSNSVQLPQHYALPSFVGEDDDGRNATKNDKNNNNTEETRASYESLREKMRTVFTDAINATCGGNADKIIVRSDDDPDDEIDIDATYENYVRLVDTPAQKKVDATIDAIGKRVVLGPNAQKGKGDKVAETPLLDQIRGVMTGLTRLYSRAQKNRAHVEVFGHPVHFLANEGSSGSGGTNNNKSSNNNKNIIAAAIVERKKDIALGDVDEEIFDDSDFARELIQRSSSGSGGAATSMITQSELQQQLKQASNKTTKKGFHRRTKGRSVSYEPRPKLVGFMVPIPCSQEEHQREALFKTIFSDP